MQPAHWPVYVFMYIHEAAMHMPGPSNTTGTPCSLQLDPNTQPAGQRMRILLH